MAARIAAAIGSVLVCLQANAVAASGPQPAGGLYDVGGYRLYLQCSGRGTPTVVLDSGLGADHTEWSAVEPIVGRFTRVCSWDRAGLGKSDRRGKSGPVTTDQVVSELHSLLDRAGVAPPYVLVGHSTGGIDARIYQKRFPDEVIGLVMVDATPEQQELHGSAIESSNGEVMDLASAAHALEAWAPPSTLPIVVIERGQSTDSVWQAEQAALSVRSPNSALIVASNSDHRVELQQPDLVAAAVQMDVEAARSGTALDGCRPADVGRYGGSCLPAGSSVPQSGLTVEVWMLLAAGALMLAVGIGVGALGSRFILRRRSSGRAAR